jgi:hypothetical protein
MYCARLQRERVGAQAGTRRATYAAEAPPSVHIHQLAPESCAASAAGVRLNMQAALPGLETRKACLLTTKDPPVLAPVAAGAAGVRVCLAGGRAMNYLPVKLCLSTTATSRFTSRGGALNLEIVPPKGMPVWLRQTTSNKCLRSLDMFTESPPDCLWPRLRPRPRPRRKTCACALLSHRKQAPQGHPGSPIKKISDLRGLQNAKNGLDWICV